METEVITGSELPHTRRGGRKEGRESTQTEVITGPEPPQTRKDERAHRPKSTQHQNHHRQGRMREHTDRGRYKTATIPEKGRKDGGERIRTEVTT